MATRATLEEAEREMRAAIALHVEGPEPMAIGSRSSRAPHHVERKTSAA
jgi:predicted RNase H-like HicB family nuclease